MSEEDIIYIKECISMCKRQEDYLKFNGMIRTINAAIPFEAMDRMLQELQLKDKVIGEMTKAIEYYTDSCPYDMYDWKGINCEKECEDNYASCWKQYFINKVKGE